MRTAFALFLVLSSPAAANVTPDALWAEMQRLAATAGAPLTAEVEHDGDDLILNRPTLNLGTADDPLSLRMERLVLQANADGSVSVVVPDRFPLTLDLPPPRLATDPDALTFIAATPGLDIRVAGLGGEAAFRILAPSVSVSLDPTAFVGDEDVNLTLALADLSLDHRQDLGATTSTVETALALGTLHSDGQIALDDGEGLSFSVDLSAITGSLFIDLDPSVLQDRMATVGERLSNLSDGQALRAALDHGPMSFAMTLTDDQPGPKDFRFAADSGLAGLRFDRTGIEAEVTLGKTSLFAAIEDPEVPFREMDLGYDELAFGASLSVLGPTDPQDYTIFSRLTGLTLSDPFWADLDPNAALPRDPISVALALSGQGEDKPLGPADLIAGTTPVNDLAMSLDELRLSGLGVMLTGEGALTFDNSDMVTFDGVPAPTGALTFTATGINTLLDRAVAAGLLPAEDLTGLRFGLALIAKPDANPDSLTSRIEFRDKSLYLNGVKMR